MAESRVLDVLKQLENQKNTSFQVMDGSVDLSIPRRSSGILSVDLVTGGGYPYGRIIEVYGAPSGGKSTATLQAIAETQKQGGVAAIVDAEHSFDPGYASGLGVRVEELLINQPDSGEDAIGAVIDLCGVLSPGDMVVVDSVAALTPRAELEGEMNDQQVGLQARMMAKGLRKMAGLLSRSQAITIFVNQTRQNIGGFGFGPKTTTPGGEALKFYATQRIEITRVGSLKKGDDVTGNKTKVKVQKNKVAPPFKEAFPDLIYGKGFDPVTDVVNLAIAYKLLKKSGSWISYEDEQLGQGVQNVVDNISPELVQFLTNDILEMFGLRGE